MTITSQFATRQQSDNDTPPSHPNFQLAVDTEQERLTKKQQINLPEVSQSSILFAMRTFSTHIQAPRTFKGLAAARPSKPAAKAVMVAAGGGQVYTVTLVLPNGKESVFRAGASKNLWDIASYAGVHLPASCK